MGWHLAGKVTAVVGTHTHVQTADDRILPGGTAYITDVGMTGPHDGIIGVEREPALARFLNGMPARFETASGDPRLHAVVVAADAETGRATAITRLSLSMADLLDAGGRGARGEPRAGTADDVAVRSAVRGARARAAAADAARAAAAARAPRS